MRLAVLGFSILLATTALASAQQTAPAAADTAKPAGDPVVAIVDGSEIHRSEVAQFQSSLPEQYRNMPLEMVFEPLLNRVIDTRLLAAQAVKEGLPDQPAVEAKLAELRQGLLRDEVLRRAVDAATTPQMLQQAYDEAKSKPDFKQEEVKASHILVETPEAAKAIIARLDKGEKFADIAKELSKDPGSAAQGGELGWFTRDKMVPEFAAAAFTMKPGTYTKEPIKSQFGYHVIMLEDKRDREPTMEEMKEKLFEQNARKAIEQTVADARKGVKIERFAPDGSALPPAAEPDKATPAPAQ